MEFDTEHHVLSFIFSIAVQSLIFHQILYFHFDALNPCNLIIKALYYVCLFIFLQLYNQGLVNGFIIILPWGSKLKFILNDVNSFCCFHPVSHGYKNPTIDEIWIAPNCQNHNLTQHMATMQWYQQWNQNNETTTRILDIM